MEITCWIEGWFKRWCPTVADFDQKTVVSVTPHILASLYVGVNAVHTSIPIIIINCVDVLLQALAAGGMHALKRSAQPVRSSASKFRIKLHRITAPCLGESNVPFGSTDAEAALHFV
jgi:hypothetical protein